MKIQFDPNNNIIKLCMMGLGMEDSNSPEDASILFLKAGVKLKKGFERKVKFVRR